MPTYAAGIRFVLWTSTVSLELQPSVLHVIEHSREVAGLISVESEGLRFTKFLTDLNRPEK